MNSECMEPGSSALEMGYGGLISHPRSHIPFLQMLQGAMQLSKTEEEEEEAGEEKEKECQLHYQLRQDQQSLFPSFPPESNLQLLLRLQDFRRNSWTTDVVKSSRAVEQLDSCITHASESQSDTKAAEAAVGHHHHPPSTAALARRTAEPGPRERKKRKRSRAPSASTTKNAEEVESQRMNHIAVERNRRRLMNEHLTVLRSLMPPSFVQRGDQASIIGGAVDFVKELEQHLLSLQAEKRIRAAACPTSASASSTTTTAAAAATTSSSASSPCTARSRPNDEDDSACHVASPAASPLGSLFVSPQYTSYTRAQQRRARRRGPRKEGDQEEEAEGVDVEATVVQSHVNLKVAGRRRPGQLVRAIAALEELRLTVLHLTITSLDDSSILYSLNLKMEEQCKLGSADNIATAVHQIFSYISAC